jgi:hypothetical protein
MAGQGTQRSRSTKFGSEGVRRYDFPENRVMVGETLPGMRTIDYAEDVVSNGLVDG